MHNWISSGRLVYFMHRNTPAFALTESICVCFISLKATNVVIVRCIRHLNGIFDMKPSPPALCVFLLLPLSFHLFSFSLPLIQWENFRFECRPNEPSTTTICENIWFVCCSKPRTATTAYFSIWVHIDFVCVFTRALTQFFTWRLSKMHCTIDQSDGVAFGRSIFHALWLT